MSTQWSLWGRDRKKGLKFRAGETLGFSKAIELGEFLGLFGSGGQIDIPSVILRTLEILQPPRCS